LRKRGRVLAAAAGILLLMGVGLAGLSVIRIATAKGYLVIEMHDPGIEVIVKQGTATIVDRTTEREIDLKPGDYEIELAEAREGLRLSTRKFTITANGHERVKVYLESLARISCLADALQHSVSPNELMVAGGGDPQKPRMNWSPFLETRA
jgi:hypothetical protein